MTPRSVEAYDRARPALPRARHTLYTPDRYQADMAGHRAELRKALRKYGWRRGELTLGEYRSALNALAPKRAGKLAYTNPYAREVWERALRRAVEAYELHDGPLFMLTILNHPWHFGLDPSTDRWELDLPAIIRQAEYALDGLSYLALVEVAPLTYFGQRYVAPHLHGFVFEELSRRQKQRLVSCFAGGLGGAPPLVLKTVYDFPGASRYNVKPPDHMDTCFARRADGELLHRGRKLWLNEQYFLWRNLRGLTYPEFTFAGGEGVDVLRSASDACGLGVRRRRGRPRRGAGVP